MSHDENHIPKHVAIIMDGNRRWARERGLPVVAGHRFVVEELVERLIEHAANRGVEYLTLWAFSTENWERSAAEVRGVLTLFRWALEKRAQRLIDKGARVRMMGNMERFPEDIRAGFNSMVERSAHNQRITVTFALNYGGRDEIERAVLKILTQQTVQTFEGVNSGKIEVKSDQHPTNLLKWSNEELEQVINKSLDTAGMPDPDLIIRPGGEQRLSGFMLWQCEYSELYFSDILMPDFDEQQLDIALEEYARRERRKGK